MAVALTGCAIVLGKQMQNGAFPIGASTIADKPSTTATATYRAPSANNTRAPNATATYRAPNANNT